MSGRERFVRVTSEFLAALIVVAFVLLGGQARADEPQPCVNEQAAITYWKAAYERADAEATKYLQETYVLWNNIDAQNRRLDRKHATIERLRAKVQRLKGADQITLQNTRGE